MTETVADEFEDIEPEAEAPPLKTTRASTARKRATTSRVPKRVQLIRDGLAKQMFMAGTMIGMGMPVTGYYICAEADGFTDAVVKLAAKDARYLDALEKLNDIAPGIMIGRTVIGIGCAMGVDRWVRSEGQRGIDPGKRAPMLLGVSAAYWEVTEDDDSRPAASYTGPPHPGYVPVA